MSDDNFYPFDGHQQVDETSPRTAWLIAFVLLFDILVMGFIAADWLWGL